MKKVLLTLLALVVVVGVLAGAGFAGYRFGYRQGVQAASNTDTTVRPFTPGNDFNLRRMPMHEFGHGMNRFHPGFGPGGFGMMPFGGRGFGFFFSPIRLLIQLAILGFIIWLAYKLLTGWRLSLTRTAVESPRVEMAQPAASESKNDETSG
jgi:hypothetical protein